VDGKGLKPEGLLRQGKNAALANAARWGWERHFLLAFFFQLKKEKQAVPIPSVAREGIGVAAPFPFPFHAQQGGDGKGAALLASHGMDGLRK
jgi:hypothetical protein